MIRVIGYYHRGWYFLQLPSGSWLVTRVDSDALVGGSIVKKSSCKK